MTDTTTTSQPDTASAPAPSAAEALGSASQNFAPMQPTQAAQPTPSNPSGDQGAASMPAAAAGTPAPAPVSQHRNFAAKLLGAMADVLGGKTHDEYSYDENGKLVTTHVANTRGQQVGNIIGNAMRGMGAGAQVRGAGAGMRSMGAGATAVMNHDVEMDDRSREQASEEFRARQTAMLNKAQTAHITQETARSAWELKANQVKFASDSMNAVSALEAQIAGDPRSQDYGTYSSFSDFLTKHPDVKDAAKGLAAGTMKIVPDVSPDGTVNGVHVFSVAPDWASQKIDRDMQVPIFNGYELGKDGKPDLNKPKFARQTVKAGTMSNGDFYNYSNAQFTKQADVVRSQQKAQDEHAEAMASIRERNAQAAEASERVSALATEVGDKKQKLQVQNDWAQALTAAGGDSQKATDIMRSQYPRSYGMLAAAEAEDFARNGVTETETSADGTTKQTIKRQRMFTTPPNEDPYPKLKQQVQGLLQTQSSDIVLAQLKAAGVPDETIQRLTQDGLLKAVPAQQSKTQPGFGRLPQ